MSIFAHYHNVGLAVFTLSGNYPAFPGHPGPGPGLLWSLAWHQAQASRQSPHSLVT